MHTLTILFVLLTTTGGNIAPTTESDQETVQVALAADELLEEELISAISLCEDALREMRRCEDGSEAETQATADAVRFCQLAVEAFRPFLGRRDHVFQVGTRFEQEWGTMYGRINGFEWFIESNRQPETAEE